MVPDRRGDHTAAESGSHQRLKGHQKSDLACSSTVGLGFNPLGGSGPFLCGVCMFCCLLFSGFLPTCKVPDFRLFIFKRIFLYVIILAFQRPRDIIWRIAPPGGHSLFHTVDLDLEVAVQRSKPEIQDCQD